MTTCKHWWQIDSPQGTAHLPARFRRCGAERTFPAVLEASEWERFEDGIPPHRRAGPSRYSRPVEIVNTW